MFFSYINITWLNTCLESILLCYDCMALLARMKESCVFAYALVKVY